MFSFIFDFVKMANVVTAERNNHLWFIILDNSCLMHVQVVAPQHVTENVSVQQTFELSTAFNVMRKF